MRFDRYFGILVTAALVWHGAAFSKSGASSEESILKIEAPPSVLTLESMAGASQLRYPQLPEIIINRSTSSKKRGSRVDAGIASDWALSNIGFFEVFTPLSQPISGQVKPCSDEIVVAVIDTGVDYTHPKLTESLWTNAGEVGTWAPAAQLRDRVKCRDKSCNGIDDDGNGFVDDVVGWDFVHDIGLPYDTHGHGTHVTGIVGASSDSGQGVPGVCTGVRVMALKYYDSSGAGYNNLNNTVRAIYYAINNGAQIINYSGGGHDPAPAERAAVEEARRQGILFIAAAGNDGHSNDQIQYYPASYGLENIVGVASVNKKNQLLPSSNFGKTVHVAAPGLGILSTLPDNRFGTMSGTSQATAFVTGAAALLMSQVKAQGASVDYKLIKQALIDGSVAMPGNENKALLAGGLLSLPKALAAQKAQKKPEPSQLALTPGTTRVRPQ